MAEHEEKAVVSEAADDESLTAAGGADKPPGSNETDSPELPSGDTPAAEKPKKKKTAKSYAAALAIKLSATALALWLIFTFVAGVFVCHSNSAYPTIRDGDFCLTYRLAKLKQGTMVIYKHDGKVRYGRIIAFGGDQVDIFSDYVTVNGFGLSENVVYPTSSEGSAITYPYNVPDNCVFVLNDYRSDISDSRTYGAVPLSELQGAVVFTMRMRGI